MLDQILNPNGQLLVIPAFGDGQQVAAVNREGGAASAGADDSAGEQPVRAVAEQAATNGAGDPDVVESLLSCFTKPH